MNKTWNKVVAAAIVTAGASAGYLYYRYQKAQTGQTAQEEHSDSGKIKEEIVSPRHHYINLFFFNRKTRDAASNEEASVCEDALREAPADEEPAKEPEDAASLEEPEAAPAPNEPEAESDAADGVHFSSLS